MRCRRRPTLPRSLERSTIGAVGLNDRVRNGNECGPYALVASEYQLCNDIGGVVDRGYESVNKDRLALLAVVCLLLGSSQAARAIRTAALGGDCAPSTCGLSTGLSSPAL